MRVELRASPSLSRSWYIHYVYRVVYSFVYKNLLLTLLGNELHDYPAIVVIDADGEWRGCLIGTRNTVKQLA